MARSSHLFGELEVELVKPYPDTMWGVMPGILDGEIVVHALNPNGIAKEKLHAGDQLVSIDGVEPQDEEHVVELLNAAHDAATPDEGAQIVLFRPALEHPDAPARLTQFEVHLLKPSRSTKWGVMPGVLDNQIIVHRLDSAGVAKDQLRIGDRIITIDGFIVTSEEQVVTLINQAHGNATPFEGCRIVVVRLYPPPALDTLYAATAAPRLQSKRKARSRLAFQRRAKPLRKTELSVVDMSA
jgi:membrane-associated protease RseP (regulator of RpoE activity)|tara:strand:- start:4757 stop:5479 length:723 start_codon:yes stop_codon:yes gene_type:complete